VANIMEEEKTMKTSTGTGPPTLVIDQIAGKIFDKARDNGRTDDNGKSTAGSSDVTIAVDFQGS